MTMTAELSGKVAVVTGGTRGIGYSVAAALLDEGAKVFICGRSGDSLKSALESLGGDGRRNRVDGIAADVSRYDDCRKVVHGAAKRFGGIDILVNNAGIGVFKPVDQLTVDEWDRTVGTNLSAVFYCCREAIPLMRQRGGGYIFNISSLAGVNAFAGGSAYNASKFGLNGFSEAMMQDVRYDGIRVSYIMPGSVATEFGAPPGFAKTVAALSSAPKGAGGDTGATASESWKLTGEDIAKAVVDLYKFPQRALASRIEMRPSQPPRKK